jgi:hypothetical protein
MNQVQWMCCVGTLATVLLSGCGTAEQVQPPAAGRGAVQNTQGLIIENDSDLPDTYPGARYMVVFHARGGVPTLRWRLEKGMLPPGTQLEESGVLRGQPERTGEFQFTLSVTDNDKPARVVQKPFVVRVRSALTLNWKAPAHVNGNRIEGSAQVTNTTHDDMDLTFIVLAVAENGRATAIGYQHFMLQQGTVDKELPFGETLPHGAYAVHVDAIGEVEARKFIYRERLQTPAPLQVTVGP